MGPSYTSKKGAFPSIPWSADNRRLISELLTILQQEVYLRKGLWPHRGETPLAQSKATNQRYLAKKLLRNEPSIMNYLSDPTAVIYYGLGIKNRVARLEKGWIEARQILGADGASLPDEHSIYEGGPHAELQEKWDVVKRNCPWFYRMRDLVGDYLENVVGATLQDGSRGKRKDATPDEEEDAEGDNHDLQEESRSDTIVCHQTSPPASAAETSSTGNSLTTTGGVSISPRVAASCPSQRQGSPELVELVIEVLKRESAAMNDRKRRRDVDEEETKRIEIRERSQVEKMRIDMEEKIAMRRLALEERQLALQERQFSLQMRSVTPGNAF